MYCRFYSIGQASKDWLPLLKYASPKTLFADGSLLISSSPVVHRFWLRSMGIWVRDVSLTRGATGRSVLITCVKRPVIRSLTRVRPPCTPGGTPVILHLVPTSRSITLLECARYDILFVFVCGLFVCLFGEGFKHVFPFKHVW